VERAITGFRRDDEGDWVAELSCGHNQHVRHRPPFQSYPWVVQDKGRHERLGTLLECPLCDRAELPEDVRLVRSSPEWDERTMPAALLHAHRVGAGTWGRIVVHDGRLRFVASTRPALEVELGPRSTQAIPPEVDHEVRPLGPVRFVIDFLTVDRGHRPRAAPDVAAHDLSPGDDPDAT
jgi:tellurite methyltransferase